MGVLAIGSTLIKTSRVRRGFCAAAAVAALAAGCSKSNAPEDASKTPPTDAGSVAGKPATPEVGPSIYTRGQAAPTAPAADSAWAERCKKTALITKASELAADAKIAQDNGDFATAGKKLEEYVNVQIQMNGEKSDFVKSAKSRVAENQWMASLSQSDRQQLKRIDQIESEAEAESTKGHFEAGLNKAIEAIRIYQQIGGQNTAAYGRLALFIADKYVLLGDFKAAAGAYKTGLAVTEQTEGVVSPVYGNGLLAMSGMWMNLGDFVEAMKSLERACDVFSLMGEGETSAAYCRMMIGVIHKEVGDLENAEKLLKEAIQRAEKLGANGKSILGEAMQHLAGVYYRAQNYQAAETTQLKAMAVLQEALGESPVLIGCRIRLARIYIKTGQLAQAESMLKNANVAAKEAFGDGSPIPSYASQYLGELYVAKQNFAAAEPLLAQALATREKGHGPSHPAVAEILENYAVVLRGLGRADEAQSLDARRKAIDASSVASRGKLAELSAKMIAERPTQRN